jgi:hypothetical protein
MALTVDATSTKVVESNVTSASWTHTCAAGCSAIYVLFVTNNGGAQPSVTFDGVAATQVSTVLDTGAQYISIYRLISPNAGAKTVYVGTFTSGYFKGWAISFLGGNFVTPEGTLVKATGSSNAPSVTATTATGEIVIDITGDGGDANPVTATVGADQTQVLNACAVTWLWAVGSYQAGASGGVMSWSLNRSMGWGAVAVSVKVGTGGGLIMWSG